MPAEAGAPGVLHSALRQGVAAARANLLPGVFLWCLGVLLLASYYVWEPTRALLEQLASFKDRHNFAYAIVATAFAGGVFPWLLRRFVLRRPTPWTDLRFGTLFWAVKGIEIELFYRFQSWLVGTGNDPATIGVKVVIDQFLYVPLWAVPTMTVAYQWHHSRSAARPYPWKGRTAANWFLRDGVPVLLSNAAVWIPAVCVIYALPLALQLPVQNLILAFWVMMLALLASG